MFGKEPAYNKRLAPLDEKDLAGVVSFFRGRAESFSEYADGLESGEYSDDLRDVMKMFQQHIDWFEKWIRFLKEG